jgi:BirA family biotin operon repressor/biotin-[acetyl-CoA-carboxylase] ligase
MIEDTLSSEAIYARLRTALIGKKIVYEPTMTSTMDVALKEIQSGASSATIIVCGEQTQGKGRLGREWVSPPGGVYLSIVLFPKPETVPYLTMIASLAVADCVKEVFNLTTKIKWPNDIILNGKKLSGLLALSGKRTDGNLYAIVGIGINVNNNFADISELSTLATSLSEATGKQVSSLALIGGLLQSFEQRYQKLQMGENPYLEWQAHMDTLGRHVKVTCGKEAFEGIADSVNSNGDLVLRLPDETTKAIPAGDVTLRV